MDKQRQQPDEISPKKLRSTFGPRQGPNKLHCIVFEGEDQNELRKASTDKVDGHLNEWASTPKNWILYSRLTACSDAHAMNAYYHTQCNLRLRDSARAVETRFSSDGSTATPFNSMVIAQLLAFVGDSRTEVFKLSALRELYNKMMSDI